MRFPQVSDRVKEAPAQALRGVFAGIGQLLLFTDKLRNKTPASQQVPRARIPQPSETAPGVAPPLPGAAPPLPDAALLLPDAAPPLPDAAPLLRDAAPPLPDAAPPLPDAAPTAGYAAPPEPEPEPTADMPSRAARVTETRDFDKTGNVRLLTTEEAGAAGPGPATGAAATASEAGTAVPDAAPPGRPAPLPNYDELSIASLRARLRGLDVTQLRQLVEYEKAHAARGDVVAMFERRIAKLEAGA
jgi:hypothetical protein